MKKVKNKKGFTLVELLVTISILGIIMILALPQISNIQNNNRTTKYEKYAETIISSGKLYVDAYTEDMFGNNTSGCVDISYNDLRTKKLLKEFKVNGETCASEKTFVRVRKSNDHYIYEVSILCTDKKGKKVYEKTLNEDGCNNLGPDKKEPTITFTPNGLDWSTGEDETVKIKIYDEYGMLENTKIKYIWMKDETEIGTYQTHNFKNKRYEGTESSPLISKDIDVPQGVSGEYYLKVVPVDVRDANGNYQITPTKSSAFKLDNTKPTCASIADNDNWTKEDVSIEITCGDEHSGCEKISYTKEYKSGTKKTDSLTIKDAVGNTKKCSYNVYLDKEAPNAPTDGEIGTVSGSSTSASIKTNSSDTTDINDGSGFKEIRYVIKNSNSTPSSSEFTSTSTSFTRSCGTSYYAYAAAVDKAGNISSAYYLGTTSDGKDEYSDYGSCSKVCGTGTKTRTNTCALVTSGLSTTCNTQECCSKTTTIWGNWSECSKKCDGGIQTRTGKVVSDYDNSIICSETDVPDYISCNTDPCEIGYTPPYNCQLRGAIKRYKLSPWNCECGSSHTSAYIHYCSDSKGNLITKGDDKSINTYWYVCPNSTSGWEVIEGY